MDEFTPPSIPAFDKNKYRFPTDTNKISENGMKLINFVEFIKYFINLHFYSIRYDY